MTQPKMSAEQALEILDRAASVFRGNREDHLTLLEAVKVLKEALSSKEPQKK